LQIKNNNFAITGAAQGLGAAIGVALARQGAKLSLLDVNAQRLDQVLSDCKQAGASDCHAFTCDVADETSVERSFASIEEHLGPVAGLVNNAGILRDGMLVKVKDDEIVDRLSLQQWQQVIDINLTGTMLLCRAVLPHLLQTKGSIVNAASTAALSGLPCGVAYSASKGGVLAMTRSIAVEYAKRGVRANCVCPGDTKTGMTDNVAFPENMDFDLMPRIMSLSGARGPEAVAGVIAMLASQDGIHITGEDIRVDGGTLS